MKFTKSHEWVKVVGDEAFVGITDYAQKELGDIVFVELPEIGKKCGQGDEVAVLESTKAAADIYAPLSGEVVYVNTTLNEQSELINQSPEDKGWIFKIRLFNKEELDSLLTKEEYDALCR